MPETTLPSEADCILFEEPGRVGTGRHLLPPCGPDEVVLQTLYTMISPGTELRMLAGHYGAEGKFPYVPGYNSIARIVSLGPEVKGWRAGDVVSAINPLPNSSLTALYGSHASFQVMKTAIDQRPVLLPAGANPFDYAITEIASISYRGMTAAMPKPGESVVVIGQGMIGAFSAAWFVAAGCRVAVIDFEQSRLDRAERFGAALTIMGDEPDVVERVMVFCRDGADIVVEASGTSPGAELAYKLIRRKPQMYGSAYTREPVHFYGGDWPRIVWQANYLEKVPFNPHGVIRGEGVTTIASGDRGLEDRQRVIEAIRVGKIRPADFIDAVLPFSKAAEGYEGLKSRKFFSVVFDWTQKETP